MKKTLTLSLLFSGLASGAALAQSVPDLSPATSMQAPPLPAPQDNAAMSGGDPSIAGTVPVATLNQYNATIAELTYQAQIEKLNAEIASSKADLAKANADAAAAASGKSDLNQGIPPVMPQYIPLSPQEAPQPTTQAAAPSVVYPTVQSIFGANGKMTADLQTGNGMIEANVGDTLPDGITIKRISMDGVLVTHDGNEQMLSFGANPLNGSKEGNNAGNGNQNTTSQVRPINPMPMMLPPHLSIGPGMPPSENSTSQ